jgi:ABC-type glycerol-3-phosphate transport system substrate-binding protein
MNAKLRETIHWLTGLLVLSMILLSAACSPRTPHTPQPTPPPTAAGQPLPEEDGEVVITFAADEYQRGLYEPFMEEFNQQNPGITVLFAPLPRPESGATLEITDWYRRLASAGDTTLTYGVNTPESGGSDYYRDLGPLIDMDVSFDSQDFWPGILDACTDNGGRILGVPMAVNLSGILFDEKAFKAAGVPFPEPGWTWEDFSKSVAALTQPKGGQIRYGYAERGFLYSSILTSVVGSYLERTGGEVDPQVLQAELQWYFDLVKSQAIAPMSDTQDQQAWQDWENLFKSETRPAMWTGSLADPIPGEGGMFSPDGDPFATMAISEYGFAPYPVSTDQAEARTTPVTATCAAISSGSQHPRAAWAWLSFLSRQWQVRNRNLPWEIAQIPSRQSVADKVEIWKLLPEKVVPSVKFALDHAWFGTLYPQAFAALATALPAVANGKEDLGAAYEKAYAQLAATPQPTPNTAPIVVATPPAQPPTDATVIDYYYDGINNPDSPDFKALVEAFNQAHPDLFIKVSGDLSGTPETNDFLGYMAEKFDCFAQYTISSDQNIKALLNLNPFLEAEGQAFVQDFPPDLLDQFRVEGNLLGLPASSQPQIMAYNADLLAKHDLKPPTNEWTFDDFIQMATAISSKNGEDNIYGFMTGEWDTSLLAGHGVRLYDLTPGTTGIDTPEMLSALTWLDDLMKSGVLLVQGQSDNWQEVNDAMTSGRVAFWITQAGLPGWYFDPNQTSSYKIGMAPLPALPEPDAGFNYAATRANFISSSTQNAQACWTWIKYLSEQPNSFPGVPARLSVVNSPSWKAQVGEQTAETFRYALSHATPVSELPNLDRTVWPLLTWRSQAVMAVMQGNQVPKEALAAAQGKAEAYLACIEPLETAGMSDEEVQKEVTNCANQADPSGPWQHQP